MNKIFYIVIIANNQRQRSQSNQFGAKQLKSGCKVRSNGEASPHDKQKRNDPLKRQQNSGSQLIESTIKSKAPDPPLFQDERSLPRVSSGIGMFGWAQRCGSMSDSMNHGAQTNRNRESIATNVERGHQLRTDTNAHRQPSRSAESCREGSQLLVTQIHRGSGSIGSAAEGLTARITYREVDAAITILFIACAECLVNIPSGMILHPHKISNY